MAKAKPSMKGLFEKTEAKEGEKKPDDIIKARGVGLKLSEWAELEKMADAFEMNLHALTARLVRRGLKEYQDGKIKPEKKQTVKFPD